MCCSSALGILVLWSGCLINVCLLLWWPPASRGGHVLRGEKVGIAGIIVPLQPVKNGQGN